MIQNLSKGEGVPWRSRDLFNNSHLTVLWQAYCCWVQTPLLAPLIPPNWTPVAVSLVPCEFCTQVTCLYLSYKGSWRSEISITSASFTTRQIWNFSNEKEDPEATSEKEWKMSTMTPFLMSTSLGCQTDTVKWGIKGMFNKGNIFQGVNSLREVGRNDVAPHPIDEESHYHPSSG